MPIFNRHYIQPNVHLLQREGPKIKVIIAPPKAILSQLKQQGTTPPPPFSGEALIDTGASISAVDQKIFQKLAISPIGVTTVRTPTTPQKQNLYPVTLFFPELRLGGELARVIGSNLSDMGIIALIGRDLLATFVFIYNGKGGGFTLAF